MPSPEYEARVQAEAAKIIEELGLTDPGFSPLPAPTFAGDWRVIENAAVEDEPCPPNCRCQMPMVPAVASISEARSIIATMQRLGVPMPVLPAHDTLRVELEHLYQLRDPHMTLARGLRLNLWGVDVEWVD
jgi:hypothetical protein